MQKVVTLILLMLAGVAPATRAGACAIPLAPYSGDGAGARLVGRVTATRGEGLMAVYQVRRESHTVAGLPDRVTVAVAPLWHGTCGMDSLQLRTGDRIVLFFVRRNGRLVPRGWVKL